MIRKFHPDKIPILMNRNKNSKLKQFDNNKYLSIYVGSLSLNLSLFLSLLWLLKRNYRLITHRRYIFLLVILYFKLIKLQKVYMKNMLILINFYILLTVNMLHLEINYCSDQCIVLKFYHFFSTPISTQGKLSINSLR